jgi:cysteine desulfurase / selenocysteine lyase
MTSQSTSLADHRSDFPILERDTQPGIPLIYLDSTASSQKPLAVIEAMNTYYRMSNANIHRGVHTLAEEATTLYEGARDRIAKFINAKSRREIIYTRNTTEAINLVAYSWGRANLNVGDTILISEMEHHSNIVPWHMLAAEKGIKVIAIPVTDTGELDLVVCDQLLQQFSPKLVAITHMSNVLGTINPITDIAEHAHAVGALVLVDGAQSVPHLPVDVQTLGADFLAFSGHKMCGPTGIGILWGREELLEAMPPFLGGGDMIRRVTLKGFTVADLPHKFEAGTPAIAEVVGLGAAVDYLAELGMKNVAAHEQAMITYALERLEEVPGLTVYGPRADLKGAVAAFTLDETHPHDIAQILDAKFGIAVRAGHHCAQPLHDHLNLTATARASFYVYNTPSDVDKLVEGLYEVKRVFA